MSTSLFHTGLQQRRSRREAGEQHIFYPAAPASPKLRTKRFNQRFLTAVSHGRENLNAFFLAARFATICDRTSCSSDCTSPSVHARFGGGGGGAAGAGCGPRGPRGFLTRGAFTRRRADGRAGLAAGLRQTSTGPSGCFVFGRRRAGALPQAVWVGGNRAA